MCPACITTLVLAAAGTGSAGGLLAVVARKVSRRKASRAPDTRDEGEDMRTETQGQGPRESVKGDPS